MSLETCCGDFQPPDPRNRASPQELRVRHVVSIQSRNNDKRIKVKIKFKDYLNRTYIN